MKVNDVNRGLWYPEALFFSKEKLPCCKYVEVGDAEVGARPVLPALSVALAQPRRGLPAAREVTHRICVCEEKSRQGCAEEPRALHPAGTARPRPHHGRKGSGTKGNCLLPPLHLPCLHPQPQPQTHPLRNSWSTSPSPQKLPITMYHPLAQLQG